MKAVNELVTKVGELAESISQEKGELYFFALALREDARVWDILLAADWIDKDRKGALTYVAKKVQSALTKKELLEISAIVLLRGEYYDRQSIMKSPSPTAWEESEVDLYGIAVKRAFIFVSTDGYFNSRRKQSLQSPMTTNSYSVGETHSI